MEQVALQLASSSPPPPHSLCSHRYVLYPQQWMLITHVSSACKRGMRCLPKIACGRTHRVRKLNSPQLGNSKAVFQPDLLHLGSQSQGQMILGVLFLRSPAYRDKWSGPNPELRAIHACSRQMLSLPLLFRKTEKELLFCPAMSTRGWRWNGSPGPLTCCAVHLGSPNPSGLSCPSGQYLKQYPSSLASVSHFHFLSTPWQAEKLTKSAIFFGGLLVTSKWKQDDPEREVSVHWGTDKLVAWDFSTIEEEW
jgi:hypothetical protein